MASFGSSPVYTVPRRKVVAVEHPMAINDVDTTMKTFGRGAPLAQVSPGFTITALAVFMGSYLSYSC
jgi:hypothetical protein